MSSSLRCARATAEHAISALHGSYHRVLFRSYRISRVQRDFIT